MSFWDHFKSNREFVLACHEKLYPPRFILEVSGRNATKDDIFEVEFEGATEELSQEIHLTLPIQGIAIGHQMVTSYVLNLITQVHTSMLTSTQALPLISFN